MNNRNVFATTLVVVGLVGCGSMPPTHFGPPCTTHECHATVTINGCKIAVDPEVIEVGRDNRNVEIHWDITTPGYAFSEDGIVINDDPRRDFQSPRRPQPTKFMLNNKHTFAKDYKYTVNVTASSTCPALTYDPWVVND